MGYVSPWNHAYVLYGTSTSQGGVCKANWSAWMAARGPKNPGAQFSEKNLPVFEIHRTSDTSMGSVAPINHAYGLYGTSTSQSNVCKAN